MEYSYSCWTISKKNNTIWNLELVLYVEECSGSVLCNCMRMAFLQLPQTARLMRVTFVSLINSHWVQKCPNFCSTLYESFLISIYSMKSPRNHTKTFHMKIYRVYNIIYAYSRPSTERKSQMKKGQMWRGTDEAQSLCNGFYSLSYKTLNTIYAYFIWQNNTF